MSLFLYRKRKSSSRSQLFKDFGAFPPRPLTARSHNLDFDIVYLSGLGAKYFSISRNVRLFKSAPEDLGHPELVIRHQAVRKSANETIEAFRALASTFSNLNPLQRALCLLLSIIMFPFILLALSVLAIKMFCSLYRTPTMGQNSLGFFSPLTQQKSEIVVKPRSIKNSKTSLGAVVAHEHIHLLQHSILLRRQEFRINFDFRANIIGLLDEEFSRSEMTFYLLSLDEVEARLHEVVLSYYRAHGSLPTDYQGFLVMLLACEILGDKTSKILSKYDVNLPKYDGLFFKLRETGPAEDVLTMFCYFSELYYAKRFICEALSVMYGNLLILYGDSDTAFEYLRTVECSCFYAQLYGEHALPMNGAGF